MDRPKRTTTFFTLKRVILTGVILLATVCIVGTTIAYKTKSKITELFMLNKELQEQNYYMAEFEFKMLGIGYHLDRGNFGKAVELLNGLHTQLVSKEGLIEIPRFADKEEELEFYLNLQNSKTGAFMDDSYPYCTYHAPTENVLSHIAALAKDTGRPPALKYPLKYLNEINTPEKLRKYLDDVSTVGWVVAKFPQTSFLFARELLSLAKNDSQQDDVSLAILANAPYTFTPEWKHALLLWFYEKQDPETGLWGPQSKNGELLTRDLNNSASIMKAFVDNHGNNIHEAFPMRYKDEFFGSALDELSGPVPSDDEYEVLHEWNLKTPKAIWVLLRYLWKDASPENRAEAKVLIEDYIRIKCEKYYIPEEGGFSYYPEGKHATLDGVSNFFFFKDIGAFSSEKQAELWGKPEDTIRELPTLGVAELSARSFDLIANAPGINSLRVYRNPVDYTDLTAGVFSVVYPHKTFVPDIMDLTQGMKRWLAATPQTMGNWHSKADAQKRLKSIEIGTSPVYGNRVPLEEANEVLQENRELVLIGFDVLQVPRYQLAFELSAH